MAIGDVVEKLKLSGSTDGKGIIIGTGPPGTLIHQCTASLDEIWIFANNIDTTATSVTIGYGDAVSRSEINFTVPSKGNGLNNIIPGLILDNSASIHGYSVTASDIVIYGYVNRLSE